MRVSMYLMLVVLAVAVPALLFFADFVATLTGGPRWLFHLLSYAFVVGVAETALRVDAMIRRNSSGG